jgi:hypothetical protein
MNGAPGDEDWIERIAAPSAELFRTRYLEPGRPVVMTGITGDWPAVERWSRAFLEHTPAERNVPVDVYEDGNFFAIGGALGHRKRLHLPFAEYLTPPVAHSRRRYYAPDLELDRYFPALAGDVTVPRVLPPEVHARLFLFAGHAAITAAHFHPFTHALTCQVTGKKRVVLYAPEDGPNLYPHAWFLPAFHWSRIDFLHPDYRRFPKLREARARTCLLEPGDALFIPAHFWHWTQGLDFSVSVLVSWKAPVQEWHFPRPGLGCLFAKIAWPVEEAARDAARTAVRAFAGRR